MSKMAVGATSAGLCSCRMTMKQLFDTFSHLYSTFLIFPKARHPTCHMHTHSCTDSSQKPPSAHQKGADQSHTERVQLYKTTEFQMGPVHPGGECFFL